jgi:hypothetical protein
MKKRVTIVTRKVMAGCLACNGSLAIWETANAQGIAARHHDKTGHSTWVDVTMSVQYGSARCDKTIDMFEGEK